MKVSWEEVTNHHRKNTLHKVTNLGGEMVLVCLCNSPIIYIVTEKLYVEQEDPFTVKATETELAFLKLRGVL